MLSELWTDYTCGRSERQRIREQMYNPDEPVGQMRREVNHATRTSYTFWAISKCKVESERLFSATMGTEHGKASADSRRPALLPVVDSNHQHFG